MHAARIFDLSTDLPILIEIVDDEEKVRSFIPVLSYDALTLVGDRAMLLAFGYVAGSVILGIGAAYAGVACVRALAA